MYSLSQFTPTVKNSTYNYDYYWHAVSFKKRCFTSFSVTCVQFLLILESNFFVSNVPLDKAQNKIHYYSESENRNFQSSFDLQIRKSLSDSNMSELKF